MFSHNEAINFLVWMGILVGLLYAAQQFLPSLNPKHRKPVNLLIWIVFLGGLGYRGWKLLQFVGPERFEPTLVHFLMLSFLLFVVGVAGVLSRRNIIIIFMSIELILNAVNLNLVAFSRYFQINQDTLRAKGLVIDSLMGPVFTIFIIVVAAAEAAVGLGIVIAMFRNRETIAIDEIDMLKW